MHSLHTGYLWRGQKVQENPTHPQKIPFLWTEGAKENSASTKNTLFVDKRHLREQLLHKRHPFWGRKGPGEEPQTKKALHF